MKKPNNAEQASAKSSATKKIFFYTLAVFLIILPILVALIIVSVPNTANTSESIVTAKLTTMQGDLIATESISSRDLGGDSLVSIINNINEGKVEINDIPSLEEGVIPIIANLDSESSSAELVLYFSITGKPSYCTDTAGDPYLINAFDATDFLTSTYAEMLYPSASLPVLQTIDGEAVSPVSIDWNYKNVSDDFVKSSVDALGNAEDQYSITGRINVNFSILPDSSTASAYDIDGNRIFFGSLAGLRQMIVNASDSVRLVIEAFWEKKDDSLYFGSAVYDFNVTIANRSTFSVSDTTISRDGFILLRATNIENLAGIRFSSDQSNISPEFTFIDDNTAQAILLYPSDISASDTEFSFSVSYRASMESFTLSLDKNRPFLTYKADIPSPEKATSFSSTTSNVILDKLHELASRSPHGYGYYNPDFIDLNSLGFEKNIDYGMKVSYNDLITPAFEAPCCEFTSSTYGVSVPALNAGIVLAADHNETMGNFVIVDHGMGLKVWYCNLSDIDVRVLDHVTKGQSVGKTSTSKISGKEAFQIYLTFKYKILNPNEIIER